MSSSDDRRARDAGFSSMLEAPADPPLLVRAKVLRGSPGRSAAALGPAPFDRNHRARPVYAASASEDHNAGPEGELASLISVAAAWGAGRRCTRSEEYTSELTSRGTLVCRLLREQ